MVNINLSKHSDHTRSFLPNVNEIYNNFSRKSNIQPKKNGQGHGAHMAILKRNDRL